MSSTHTLSAEQLLKHSGWARSLARQLVADAATAEDVVQETWVAALREQPSADRPLRPWLERVIRNFAANSRRSRKTRERHEQAAGGGEATSPSVGDVVAKAEGQQRVVAAVLSLSEPYRSVVLLRYYEGLSAAEIARRGKTPAGTVRWQIKTGLQQLRDKLDADESGDRRAWCTALLPLAGFQSVHEVAAMSSAATLAADRARSSFLTILKGAVVMKSAWMVGAAAVCAAILFWTFQNGVGPLALTPIADGPAVVAEVVKTDEPVYVRSPVPDAPTPEAPEAAVNPQWRSSVNMRFVDRDGVAVAGVSVRYSRKLEVTSDEGGRVELPVSKPAGSFARHQVPLRFTARHEQFAMVHREVELGALVGDGDAIELGVIKLETGGSLAGQVIDLDGAPVAGVRVSVSGRSDGTTRTSNVLMAVPESGNRVGKNSAKTDESGNFRIDNLLPGSNVVEASIIDGPSWADGKSAKERVEVVVGSTANVQITLQPDYQPKDIVTIVVLDPDGKPVPNAYAKVQSNYGNGTSLTDENGRARCGFRRGSRKVDVTVTAPKNAYAAVVHKGAYLGETLTIRFARPIPLPLTVTSDSGRAIGEVAVRLTTVPSGGFLGFGKKRAVDLFSGEFAVAADGAVVGVQIPNDRFQIEVKTRGHEVESFGPYEPSQVKEGIALTLAGTPMVAGHVVDDKGKPVAGAVVQLHRRPSSKMIYNGFPVWLNPRGEERMETGEDGAFELTVRGEQSFFVRVAADGFAATMTSEMVSAELLRDGKPLRLTMNRGGSITGRVARADGRSSAGAIVVANRGDGFARTVRVDADGSYRFELLTPGQYEVQRTGRDLAANASNWQTSFGRPIQQLADPNCTVVAGEVHRCDLGAGFVADARLTGHVQVPGWALEGRRVSIEFANVKEGQQSAEGWHATIGADGRFEVPLLASGSMLLRIADGSRLIEAKLTLLAGANHYDLKVETSPITLRDLPSEGANGEAGFVIARWAKGATTILQPIEVDGDGVAKTSLPKGKVSLERLPTEDDVGAILLAGGFTMIPFREITVE